MEERKAELESLELEKANITSKAAVEAAHKSGSVDAKSAVAAFVDAQTLEDPDMAVSLAELYGVRQLFTNKANQVKEAKRALAAGLQTAAGSDATHAQGACNDGGTCGSVPPCFDREGVGGGAGGLKAPHTLPCTPNNLSEVQGANHGIFIDVD